MKAIYKVVERRESGALVSFNNPDAEVSHHKSVVHYSTDIVTVPHEGCGDLCAFSSLEATMAFLAKVQPVRGAQVWKARGTPGKWGKAFDSIGSVLTDAPKGTLFLSTIILAKKITDVDRYGRAVNA
jgi:hypothetical protein